MQVEIWSDVKCPWCLVGKRRFEKALADFPHRDQVEVIWKSFQLDPGLPEHYDGTEQQYLAERKGIAPEQVRQMWDHIAAQGAGEGITFDFDAVVVGNSFTAHRFLHLAKSRGLGIEAKEALMMAHFEQGKDTGSTEFLVSLGSSLGMDPEEIRGVLASDAFAEDVKRDIAEAAALGVSGVPFFVLDRKYGVSGAQPAEVFTEALNQAWRESNPLTVVGNTASTAGSADGEACGPEGCS
jgi:predicted DsbA family dithiol-disulfide isomerase